MFIIKQTDQIIRQLLTKARCLLLIGKQNRPLSLIIVFLFLFMAFFDLPGRPRFLQQQLSTARGQAPQAVEEVQDMLRFHVRAHSNSPGDQRIKNLVAQRVLAYFQPEWSRCRSSDELSRLLVENKAVLEDVARETLQDYGCLYDVRVSLSRDVFPARCYEGKLYPPGEYAALYLIIGEGYGENWWCVLFPPLCFSILPPLAEENGEQGPENARPLAARPVGKSNAGVTQAPAATGREDHQAGRENNNFDRREKTPCKWRSWLWEVLTKIKRQNERRGNPASRVFEDRPLS